MKSGDNLITLTLILIGGCAIIGGIDGTYSSAIPNQRHQGGRGKVVLEEVDLHNLLLRFAVNVNKSQNFVYFSLESCYNISRF